MRRRYVSLFVTVFCLLAKSAGADYPAEGCFWTGNCLTGWMGGCGMNRMVVGKSTNCAGLCPSPQYPACALFSTHYQCCNMNKPVVSSSCARCSRRADFGKAYLCCEDCSAPTITDKNSGEGFCMTGARLALTLKPLDVYKWHEGTWGNCSTSCGGGTRSRQVSCHDLSTSAGKTRDLLVAAVNCQMDPKPIAEEGCNLHLCPKPSSQAAAAQPQSKRGMSGWVIALYVLLSSTAVAGIGFLAYSWYRRQESKDNGFVYVMMEGYN